MIRDLRLYEHGLRIVERPLLNYVVEAPDRGPAHRPTGADTMRHLATRAPRDAERYRAYHAQLETGVALLKDLLLATPPTNLKRFGDCGRRCQWGRSFRALPLESQRVIHELFTRSAGDLLDGWFEDEGLKARIRLRWHRRQLRQSLHTRHCIRVAAPRLRRR